MQTGQKVRIRMLAGDASFVVTDDGLVSKRETHDVGTGIILRLVPDNELCVPEEESGRLWQVAVIEGRFDDHRNDLGHLCCWDWELAPLEE